MEVFFQFNSNFQGLRLTKLTPNLLFLLFLSEGAMAQNGPPSERKFSKRIKDY